MKSKFFFKGITGITNKSLMSLFFKEIKTDLLKLTRAIGAWTLFFKEQRERIAHSRSIMSKRAKTKERIPDPAINTVDYSTV